MNPTKGEWWAAPCPDTYLIEQMTWRRPISYPWES